MSRGHQRTCGCYVRSRLIFRRPVGGQRNEVELICQCVVDPATDAPEPDAVPRVEVVRQIPPVRRNLSTENSDAERRNGDSRRRESARAQIVVARSEENTSELQSLMRISYAVSCLKKKTQIKQPEAANKEITINIQN